MKGARAPQPDLQEASAGEVISLERPLVQQAQAGDTTAMRALLMQHSEALYCRVILPRVGDPSTAEDLLRTTMITALEKLQTFRWQGCSIYFWLRQIAVNKVIDHHRGNQRTLKLAERLAQEPELPVGGRRDSGPEAQLIAHEERQINLKRVQATLARLNPRYRSVLELRLFQELPREECARRLEVTLGTFDVLFFRAAGAFRRAYGEP